MATNGFMHVNDEDGYGLHRVKIATVVRTRKAKFYVWECVCGESSILHLSAGQANESYKTHKATDVRNL